MLVLGVALLAVSLVGIVAHFGRPGPAWVLGITAFTPYLMLAAPVAALVLLVAAQWVPAGVAVVVALGCALLQLRLFRRVNAPPDADELVVLTSNLLFGRAEPDDVVRAVTENRVDVLLVQELTPQLQHALLEAGLGAALPFHLSDPRADALGTGLWSRHPLVSPVLRTDFFCAFAIAELSLPGRAERPVVASLHLAGPWPRSGDWQRDIAHLPAILAEIAATGAPAVVGGDFNATPDVRQFRALLRDGWANAAEQAGAGITRSFPADTRYPALIAIDHVLSRGGVGRSARTLRIRGTDHRALLVSLALPRRAG